MQIATLRVGHFEINYGDAHFRRTDNGNAIYNPFVGNYIMDAFTTEIGGEVYLARRASSRWPRLPAARSAATSSTPDSAARRSSASSASTARSTTTCASA